MPYLRLYSGESLEGQWELAADRLNIGRTPDNDIVLPNPEVSKRHAHIETDGGVYVLVDDGSANGIVVNKKRVTKHTLTFWDEIEIYPYKLVFMSRARLPGEATGQEIREGPEMQQMGTVVMKKDDIALLREQLEQSRVAYLTLIDSGVRLLLEKVNFTLGRGRDNDLRCGGWFSPRLVATIQRRQDGHYLIPAKRGRVFVNGESPREPVRLIDNTGLEIQGIALKYFFRPIDGR